MTATIKSYVTNNLQLWIFKVVLIFSVFAFSGYNQNIVQSTNQYQVTELVESIDFEIAPSAISCTQSKVNAVKETKKSYITDALYNYNHVINIAFKIATSNNYSYNISTILLPSKTPLSFSEDELPILFSI